MEFIFIHINKTAGSSIEEALGLRFRHRTATQVIADIGIEKWRAAFTFTVVRNPWDKVVSHYAYRVDTNQTGLGDGRMPFSDWVREAYDRRNPRYHDKPMMFMPQTQWICDEAGDLLVNYVGRFENLQQDFNDICVRIGHKPATLPHRKPSRHGTYRDYYDDETRRVVGDWFAADLERFGYTF